MHGALPRFPAYDDSAAPSALTGILAHLDAVYGFALTLTGDGDRAEEITEEVFGSVHDDLWATLGGHGLRERLLARCVAAYTRAGISRAPRESVAESNAVESSARPIGALLRGLPWDERAAIALVDQLGLTHTAGATVLGTSVTEFRALLHRARGVLFTAYRAGAR